MVRLIVETIYTISTWGVGFQFQNGSINSIKSSSMFLSCNMFQFQNGSINRHGLRYDFMSEHQFQFQNGSINSR